MDSYRIEAYRDEYRVQLLEVWERSVLATHHFLDPVDFEEIKKEVQAIDFNQLEVYCLTHREQVLGFVGVWERKVEMLFLDPAYFGQGLGKKLLSFALTELDADRIDVNEQNTYAVEFYLRCGFEVLERVDRDDQGRLYPILRMRLIKGS